MLDIVRSRWRLAAAGAVVILVATLLLVRGESDYRVDLVMPSAAGVFEGMTVRENNVPIGKVEHVGVKDGKAVVRARIDESHAPLRQGTTPVIDYRSVVGEVYLQLEQGPTSAPALPNGSVLATAWSQVTVEDVLETLDPATRKKLKRLLAQTSTALSGQTAPDVARTIEAAGPTVDALGTILQALSQDGPALHAVVTQLNQLAQAAATRREALSGAVDSFASLATEVAGHREQLRTGLSELPSTLDQARSTLRKVGPAVDKAEPLLEDLQPAAARLPGVAEELAPLLTDLQPTARSLRRTLGAANTLLGTTPSLLDTAHAVVPDLDRALTGLAPAIAFLRPYTPDLVGWLSNWAGVFGSFTSQGHAGHLLATVSATGVNNLPKIDIPGLILDKTTAPGTSAGQPWTDANGGELK